MKKSNYSRFCKELFKRFFHDLKEKELQEKNLELEKAKIPMEYIEYYSVAIMNLFIAAIISILIPVFIYYIFPNPLTLFLVLLIPLIVILVIAFFYLYQPKYIISRRAENIDRFLPYAINYISSMAVAGVSPSEIFQTLSTIRVYGEIKNEAKRIAKEINVMGIDNITALKNAIELSPSHKFISFIQGMIGTIQSGSDLNNYLSNISEKYLGDDLIERKKHLDLLGVVAEGFVISVIAFPIFLVIILSVMGFFGGSMDISIFVLFLFSFLILPFVYLAFYFIVKSATVENVSRYIEKNNEDITSFYKKNKTALLILLFSLFTSIIIIAIFLLLSNINIVEPGLYLNLDILFLVILIFLGPISYYLFIQHKKKKEIQDRLPDFLTELGDSLSSGMTVLESIKTAEKGKYGELNSEIKKMKSQLSWNIAVKDVFINLSERVRSGILQRVVIIINEGILMGGNTSSIFKAAAKEVGQINQIEHQRKANMSIYFSVIVLCFFVFLAIILILDRTIFTSFFELQTEQLDQLGSVITIETVEPLLLKYGLFSFVYVQALGSGILAGYMMDGKVSSGVRYAIVLAVISFIVFKILF